MENQRVTVVNKTGLHARPAATFARLAKKYQSIVKIQYNNKIINAKSTVAILSAGIGCGSVIELTAEGEDELAALQALIQFVESGCGEGQKA